MVRVGRERERERDERKEEKQEERAERESGHYTARRAVADPNPCMQAHAAG